MKQRLSATWVFPLAALLGSALAYQWPEPWLYGRDAIVPLLSLVMFGMGLSLVAENFRLVWRRPGVLGLGLLLQFSIMPLLGWGLAQLLVLAPPLLTGLVLLGSCPGGTASNVICYLARGDVALSISLTACSTLLAVLLTPALSWFYLGQQIPVPVLDMLWSLVSIVLLPVLGGLLCNRYLHRWIGLLKTWFPTLSMLAIVLIIAIIVALNRDQLQSVALALLGAVVLHNALGLLLGYGGARLFGHDARTARTLAIEVGMQNSGLAVALANSYFSSAAALPAALFSIWHNVSGAALAGYWSGRCRRS